MARPIKIEFPSFAAGTYKRGQIGGVPVIQEFTDETRTTLLQTIQVANPQYDLIDRQLRKEEDKFNTAFAPPAECPGLFRYGLQLDPIIYARSVTNMQTGLPGASVQDSKLQALLNVREDCGFPGIPKVSYLKQ